MTSFENRMTCENNNVCDTYGPWAGMYINEDVCSNLYKIECDNLYDINSFGIRNAYHQYYQLALDDPYQLQLKRTTLL